MPFARADAGGRWPRGRTCRPRSFADPIEITVIPISLAKVTAGNAAEQHAQGRRRPARSSIKVERQYDFAGEFKVKFELPKDVTGVTAEEVTIPAGKDEVKLVLEGRGRRQARRREQRGRSPSPRVYDKKHTITHETKVTFTVAAPRSEVTRRLEPRAAPASARSRKRATSNCTESRFMRYLSPARAHRASPSSACSPLVAAQEPRRTRTSRRSRPSTSSGRTPVEYGADIEPIFENKCFVCHSGNVTEGKFDMSTLRERA